MTAGDGRGLKLLCHVYRLFAEGVRLPGTAEGWKSQTMTLLERAMTKLVDFDQFGR